MTAALNSGHYSNGRSRSPLRFPFRLPETGLPCNTWPPPLFFRHILACHHPPTHLPTARLGNETLFRRRGRVAQDLRLLGRVAQPAQLGRAFLTRTRQAAWQRGDPTYLSRARGSRVCCFRIEVVAAARRLLLCGSASEMGVGAGLLWFLAGRNSCSWSVSAQ